MKEKMICELFDVVIPKVLCYYEECAAKGSKFICGDKCTIADFCAGGLYVNYFCNPHVGYCKDKF